MNPAGKHSGNDSCSSSSSSIKPGGGSTESSFANARPGTTKHRLWTRQMSSKQKFRADSAELFSSRRLGEDRKAVLYVPLSGVSGFMAEEPERACALMVHKV